MYYFLAPLQVDIIYLFWNGDFLYTITAMGIGKQLFLLVLFSLEKCNEIYEEFASHWHVMSDGLMFSKWSLGEICAILKTFESKILSTYKTISKHSNISPVYYDSQEYCFVQCTIHRTTIEL